MVRTGFVLYMKMFVFLLITSISCTTLAATTVSEANLWEHPMVVTFVMVGLTVTSAIGGWLLKQMLDGQKNLLTISATLSAHVANEEKQVKFLTEGIDRVADRIKTTNDKLDTIDADHKELKLHLTKEMTRVTTLVDSKLQESGDLVKLLESTLEHTLKNPRS